MGIMQISAFLSCFRQQQYEALFSAECINALTHIENKYGTWLSPKVIYETELCNHCKNIDFSVQLLSMDPLIGDYWLEFDYDEYCCSQKMTPSVFYNASAFVVSSEWWTNYQTHMEKYIGSDRATSLETQLKKTVVALDGFCSSLFQIGKMDSRGEKKSVRIYTRDMSHEHLINYLQKMQWTGDYSLISQWMTQLKKINERLGFTVSFDVMPDRISSKIGIEFTIPLSAMTYYEDIKNTLNLFIQQGVCVPEKAEDIIRWSNAPAFQLENQKIINMITHIKLQFDSDKMLKAKCYLGQIPKRNS